MTLPKIPQDSTFVYRAFGVSIFSNVAIPGMRPQLEGLAEDLSLNWGEFPDSFSSQYYPEIWYRSLHCVAGTPFLTIYFSASTPSGYWLRYVTGIEVLLDSSLRQMWVIWPDSSCLEDAATYVLGPVMAILAQLRGATCLHGCAVAIEDRVVALLGPQGAGKSTSAAAFAQQGYSVMTDDLILLKRSGQQFAIEPTYPILRLWPRSVELLFGHEDALPQLTPDWDKRGLNLIEEKYKFQETPLPLVAIYLLQPRLDSSEAPILRRITGSAALMQLVSNSWAHYVNKPAFLAEQLRVLTTLSRTIPIREATAHSDFARITDFCRLIVEDAQKLTAAN